MDYLLPNSKYVQSYDTEDVSDVDIIAAEEKIEELYIRKIERNRFFNILLFVLTISFAIIFICMLITLTFLIIFNYL